MIKPAGRDKDATPGLVRTNYANDEVFLLIFNE